MMARMRHPRSCHASVLLFLLIVTVSFSYAFFIQKATRIRQRTAPTRRNAASKKGHDGARGAALLLEQVSVFRGPAQILKDVNWRIEPRTKWALVGANGAGKSTLLKAIVGEVPYDGDIWIGTKNHQIGYLKQTAVSGSNRTVYDEASSGMVEINKAKQAMKRAQEMQDLVALEKATLRFESLGGYKQEQKVASVLKGLGFSELDFDRPCDELSGGWQMRVAFARLLLSEPALCLMDEPGNHLDSAAKRWLAKYLADYEGDGAMILVTHDVELLQSMDHIAEIIPGAGSLQIYKSCNYKQYLELKEQRAASAVAEYQRNAEKAAKLQAFVDRFGASATKASAAQSRVKQLEKMEREGLLDSPTDAITAQRVRPTLVLSDPPKAIGESLLRLKDAQVGYGDKPLVSEVDLDITKGMKLLIRGPNGAGKSTVLHAIKGSIPLLGGQRIENPSLRLGMFTQDLAQELDPNAKAVDLATAWAREGPHGDIMVSEQEVRSAMGRLGLQGEKPLCRIADLSGGEKARVALAMFALKPSNVYLFDEVSNHLDMECVQALSHALRQWGDDTDGAVVVVSHDRSFCEQIEFTHVATVCNGRFTLEQRNARESDWVIDGMASTSSSSDDDDNKNDKQESKEIVDSKLRKKAYNAPKRISKLEELIQSVEERIAILDEDMLSNGNNVEMLVHLTKERKALEEQVSQYLEEWEELEELLSQVA